MTELTQRSLMLALYRAGMRVAEPLAPLILKRRLARGKEDPSRLHERLGQPTRPRPDCPLIWIHGASVGEAVATLPLITALLAARSDAQIMLTTGTVTSARLMDKRLPAATFHQFAPIDSGSAVRGFLDHWRPDLALIVESELWPNLILEAQARGVPLALINARMSDASFRNWGRARSAARSLMAAFTLVLAQDRASAAKIEQLGAQAVTVTGNLKFSGAPLPYDAHELERLSKAAAGRPRFIAAQTHESEEEAAVAWHIALARTLPDLLTIIVPRHPDRGAAIAEMLRNRNIQYAQRSLGHSMTPDCAVYLADTMGELGIFYRLARVAFVGGSLIAHGGQNPLEPARLGLAVLSGPHVANFTEAYQKLTQGGAAEVLPSNAAIGEALARLLTDGPRATHMGRRGEAIAGDGTALTLTMAALGPLLKGLPHHARA